MGFIPSLSLTSRSLSHSPPPKKRGLCVCVLCGVGERGGVALNLGCVCVWCLVGGKGEQ